MMLEEIPFNLAEEMELVGELFRPLAREKGLELAIDIRPDVPNKLIGDPFRLRQVISNLVSNAVKFTEKGRIVIGVTLMEAYRSHVNVLFTVEDTGIGIPRDRIKEIFGSYTQARGSMTRKFGGTGLGTTIAKQLVELMHGEIWVESPSSISEEEDFPGSKFSFTIDAYSNEKIPKLFDFDHITRLNFCQQHLGDIIQILNRAGRHIADRCGHVLQREAIRQFLPGRIHTGYDHRICICK